MREWKEVKIGDVCSVKRGASPRPIQNFMCKNGMPWVKIADATRSNSRYINSTEEFIIKEGVLKSRTVTPGTLIVSNSATPGLPKIMGITGCVHDGWLIIDDFNGVLKEYMYYKFIDIRRVLCNQANGSVFMNLKTDIVKSFTIHIPTIEEQAKMVSFLENIDSKIECNQNICANLEAQAQALFKHWFIDFAPFKDGKFVESELGMIPEGWRVGKLGEIADINPSRTIQKGNKATYLDMKNMPTIGSFPLSWEVKEYNGGMKFMNGDTLMARITPCLENGKVAYVNFLQNQEIAFGSTEYIVMSPKNNLFSEYLYFLCRYSSFINYATKNMNGSSGRQRVSGDTISNYDMIIAPKEIYKEVEPIFKDIMCHIKSLGQESILLSSLRDTLLPKLMSGEIKV